MSEQAPSTYSPVQRRDVRLLAIFRGLSFLGDGLAMVALYLRVAPSGHAWAVAGLGIGAMVPFALLATVSGVVADRVRAKPYLVSLGALEAVVCAGLGLFHSIGATLGLVVALNAVVAFSLPGYTALLPSLAGEANINAAQGTLQAAQGLASIAGPVLGGVLVGVAGQSLPLYLDAISFLLGALGTALLRGDRLPVRHHDEASSHASAGFRLVLADPLLRDLNILIVVFMLVLGMINVAEVFYITQTLHGSALAYGALGASFGAGTVVGALVGGRLSTTMAALTRRVVLGVVLIGLCMVGAGSVEHVVEVYPPLFVAGIAVGIANVAAMTILTMRSPDHVRGRVFAALIALDQIAQVGATVAGGAILSLVAPRTVFFIGGVGATAVSLAIGPLAWRSRHAPSPLAQALAD